MAEMIDRAPAMLVIRPGDKILVTFTDDVEPDLMGQITAGLTAAFPRVEFVIIAGVSGLAVAAGDG